MSHATSEKSTSEKSAHSSSAPKPVIKKLRWPMLAIWLAPILAAVMAGIYFYDFFQDRGREITLTFSDATGLKVGQSQLMHLGVGIGQVENIQLSPDQKHAYVLVRLERSAMSFARQGAIFWIVRPEISAQEISGLATVLSGPYIDSLPGTGDEQKEFTGLDKAPATQEPGLRIVLEAPRMDHLQADIPVYFRGVQVGTVEDIQLGATADAVDVHAFIKQRFAPLVKANSKFWIVSGVDLKAGLLSGVQMKVESFRSLLVGGIAFATPQDNMGAQAEDGSEFPLYDDVKKEWLDWAPKIEIGPDDSSTQPFNANLPPAASAIRSAVGS
ncbi:MAG: MlaD family protein [Tepidisphaeraceae bacterium]|jgi:paraquat-inducible protein B